MLIQVIGIRPPIREAKLVGIAWPKGVAIRKKKVMVAKAALANEAGEFNGAGDSGRKSDLRVIGIAPG
jgi:hypothetical protein